MEPNISFQCDCATETCIADETITQRCLEIIASDLPLPRVLQMSPIRRVLSRASRPELDPTTKVVYVVAPGIHNNSKGIAGRSTWSKVYGSLLQRAFGMTWSFLHPHDAEEVASRATFSDVVFEDENRPELATQFANDNGFVVSSCVRSHDNAGSLCDKGVDGEKKEDVADIEASLSSEAAELYRNEIAERFAAPRNPAADLAMALLANALKSGTQA